MKRSITDTKAKKEAPGEQAQIEQLVQTYSGKSETELLSALSGMSEEERGQLATLSRELSPMLNGAQQQKLTKILAALQR